MQTYDPQKFQIIVFGVPLVGYADTFMKAGRNEDGYKLSMSADGFGARVKNANKSGRFEATLKRSSPSNDYLAGLAIEDEITAANVGVTAIQDSSGTGFANAFESWVVKQGDIEGSNDIGDITWIIETWLLEIKPGGTLQL